MPFPHFKCVIWPWVAFWCRFKTKYHPEECGKRREDQLQAIQRRRDIFMRLMELGRVECSLDLDRSDEVIKLLDSGQPLSSASPCYAFSHNAWHFPVVFLQPWSWWKEGGSLTSKSWISSRSAGRRRLPHGTEAPLRASLISLRGQSCTITPCQPPWLNFLW